METQNELKRCFGMRETVTITVGTVIGVGLFTVGANVVGMLGPLVIFATLAAMLISIYPALLYAEMGALLPYAGGTYQYASAGLGRPFGMLAGWCFIISMVSVASGEALAFSFYFRTLFEALGISLPVNDLALACIAIGIFIIINLRGVKLSGRMQNGFMFFFWGVAVVWVLSMIPYLHFDSFTSVFASTDVTFMEFLPCVALVWWCFAGFETCCAMGEEIKFPQINIPRALYLAPFIVFTVTALFQWVLVGIVPKEGLAALIDADAPYALGMQTAGIIGFPLILLCAGIAFGGDFSTLNATVSAPSRYLYTMARDGSLPKFLSKVNQKYQTPHIAILVLGVLMLFLISTNSILYIASLSLFATLLFYIIGILSACALRKKYAEKPRSYRAPGIIVGAPISVILYGIMMTQLEKDAVYAGIIWCIVGLIIYAICRKRNKQQTFDPFESKLPEAPSKEERKHMDREFKIWGVIVITTFVIVLALYLFTFFR